MVHAMNDNKENSITEEVLAEEREIYAEQARASGKPDKVVEKIVDGRMNKFYEENCLLEQAYVRDTDKKIEDVIKEAIADLGENIMVARFARFQLGEGLPQGEEDSESE